MQNSEGIIYDRSEKEADTIFNKNFEAKSKNPGIFFAQIHKISLSKVLRPYKKYFTPSDLLAIYTTYIRQIMEHNSHVSILDCL